MNYSVHSVDGTTVALVDCVLDAQRINRTDDRAHFVLRVADGALIASKARRRRGPSMPGEWS